MKIPKILKLLDVNEFTHNLYPGEATFHSRPEYEPVKKRKFSGKNCKCRYGSRKQEAFAPFFA